MIKQGNFFNAQNQEIENASVLVSVYSLLGPYLEYYKICTEEKLTFINDMTY